MRKTQTIIMVIVIATVISGCREIPVTADVDGMRASTSPTIAMRATTAVSSQAADFLFELTPAPNFDRVWVPYFNRGNSIWILDEGQPYAYELPFHVGDFYDYNPVNHCLLLARKFPDHGDPASGKIAVSDLTMANLVDGDVETLISDDVRAALWFPDGETFAYILATDQTFELHRRSFDGVDQILVKDVAFKWSIAPSGQAVAFTRESGYGLVATPGLYVIDLETGEERMLSDVDVQGWGSINDQPFWSPDSEEMIFSHWAGPDEPRLILARADGTMSYDIELSPEIENEWWATVRTPNIIWHPDGEHLVVASEIAYEFDGPDALVFYRLDRDRRMLVEGKYFAQITDFEDLIGWAKPGISVWVFFHSKGIVEVFLP
jgi:hypothetical protein